jgi:hypothetical protein
VTEEIKLTLQRAKVFINVLLDEIGVDPSDVNIQVKNKTTDTELARVELADVLADIDRLSAE